MCVCFVDFSLLFFFLSFFVFFPCCSWFLVVLVTLVVLVWLHGVGVLAFAVLCWLACDTLGLSSVEEHFQSVVLQSKDVLVLSSYICSK